MLGPYGDWKNIGECSVTCGKNGTQHSQRHCAKDVALVVPRDKPLFCGETLNRTETCSAENECPSKKNILPSFRNYYSAKRKCNNAAAIAGSYCDF